MKIESENFPRIEEEEVESWDKVIPKTRRRETYAEKVYKNLTPIKETRVQWIREENKNPVKRKAKTIWEIRDNVKRLKGNE